MKRCNECLIELPLTWFGGDKKMKDGLNSKCKPCRNMLAWLWLEADPPGDRREKGREYTKAWQRWLKENDPERYKAMKRKGREAYRRRHPEQHLAENARWWAALKADPERYAAYRERHRERQRNASPEVRERANARKRTPEARARNNARKLAARQLAAS